MATNAPKLGGRAPGSRPAGSGKQLPQGARVGVTLGVKGGGVPANVRPLLGGISKGGNSTTNSQPS